jgi:hypothetical protein
MIAIVLWKAARIPITVETATLSAILAGFLLIGLCDFYLILFQQGRLMFFLILGLLAAHTKSNRVDFNPAFMHKKT